MKYYILHCCSHIGTYLLPSLFREDLELYIPHAAAHGVARPRDPEHRVPRLVLDREPRVAEAPQLLDPADDGAGRAGHLHLLAAAGGVVGLAPGGSLQVDDLLALVIHDLHSERSSFVAAPSGAAAAVLLGEENVLAQGVLHSVLIGSFKTLQKLLF